MIGRHDPAAAGVPRPVPAQPLGVLIVEDSPDDADLLVRQLRQAGFDPQWRRVETEPDFLAHLRDGLDVVLCDYRMPRFSGLRALKLLKETGLEIPFILLSGTIGEEIAVKAMKLGAADYLMKDRLVRLGTAVTQAVAVSRSLRERQLADLALRESEARFRQLAENINEVFWITDPTRAQVLYVSPAYEKIWGRACDQLYATPHPWPDAIHPEDRARLAEGAKGRPMPSPDQEEYRILRPDGSERWIRDRAFAVHAPGGELHRLVGVAEDITESRDLSAQFLRAQRMEAIGTLAGGIAHDLNNILGPMLIAPLLLKDCAKTERDRQLLDLIDRGARRSSNIIRQLLTFSRGSGGDRVRVQWAPLLGEMVGIIRETFPRNITVESHAARDLRSVLGDPTQLHQVLMNLCVNARDAMPEGGKLTLLARNEELDAAAVRGHAPAQAGPYLALSVTDTGEGIPAENVDRIFDPFFTTKTRDKGTGLGLSTAVGIVRSHGGFLTVKSAPGRGSTFIVHVPAAPAASAGEAVPEGEALASGSGELVLIVDDEAPMITATRMLLEMHGYRVVSAGDGAEGLAVFLENRDAIRVVLTDLMMPVMGGLPLIRALRAAEPNLRVLVATGLNDQGNYSEIMAAGANGVLAKPFSPSDLLVGIQGQLRLAQAGSAPPASAATGRKAKPRGRTAAPVKPRPKSPAGP